MKKLLSVLILSSLMAGSVYAETIYKMRVPMEVAGISNGDSGGDGGGGSTEPPAPEADPSGWLAYFQSQDYLTDLTDLNQWGDDYAQIDNLGHPNAGLPSTAFGISQLGELWVEDPYINNVHFLSGLKSANGLYFSNATGLTDISGLRNLEVVNRLDLANTNVSSISALSNLRSADSINFEKTHVVNISPIKNLSNVRQINLDYDKNTFGPLLPLDSPLCQSFIGRRTNIEIADKDKGYMMRGASPSEICESTKEAWLVFLHNFGKHTGDVSLESLAKGNYLNMDFSPGDFGNELTIHDSDIPSTPYPLQLSGSDMWISITSTMLTNIDFLSEVTALESLELNYNSELKNLNGLSNLTEVSRIVLENTPNLTDISGLRNISRMTSSFMGAGSIVVDNLNFSNRPAVGTPFCQGIKNGTINMEVERSNGSSTWFEKVAYGDICY